MMEALIAIFVIGMFAVLFIGLVRKMTDGQWNNNYSQHKCGHIQYMAYEGRVCGKCGELGGWKQVTVRARFPFGWEIKK